MRVGKYRLERELGKGGFGMVYEARDLELDRECALKFLLPQHAGDVETVQRFLQEARSAAKVRHLGIVTVFECALADNVPYIAMELLHGESLAERVHPKPPKKPAPMSIDVAIAIARQIAAALGTAHAAGIVHRDLKPENVFLIPDAESPIGERVKVLDFGIAKLAEPEVGSVKTASYQVFGSPKYMSPEQCRSAAKVDARSDIYALGVMLYEMVCGELPFDGDPGALIALHQIVVPPKLCTKRSDTPPALEALVDRMLAKEPDDRPASMDEVVEGLEQFRAATGHQVVKRTPSKARLRWPIVGALVAVPVIAVVVVIAAKSSSTDAQAPRDAAAPVVAIPDAGSHIDASPPKIVDAGPRPTTVALLLAAEHAAIGRGDEAALATLLAPDAFGFGAHRGVGAGDQVLARLLAWDVTHGTHPSPAVTVTARRSTIGTSGDAAWIVELLDVGTQHFAVTQLAVRTNGEWRVAAWHWAVPLKDSEISDAPEPVAVNSKRFANELDSAFTRTFSSFDALEAAIGAREDSYYLGSAPGELALGGANVVATLDKLGSPTISIADGVAVGQASPTVGWGAANIHYAWVWNGKSRETTFRVLAVLVKESTGWKIVGSQWSHAIPNR
jgi:hypothetical protein